MNDTRYLQLLLDPIRQSTEYRPRLGQGRRAVSMRQFEELYAADPFYRWLGLNSPQVYNAHRVAGGITSLYRQIGIGCERLIKAICCDTLAIEEAKLRWAYEVQEGNSVHQVHVDMRIALEDIGAVEAKQRVEQWLEEVRRQSQISTKLAGVVFEIRQGYKSKDSKRQIADMRTASRAYQNNYLPCMLVLSEQMDVDVKERYQNAGWIILTGSELPESRQSTYAFMREVIGYDLAAFFERHSEKLRQVIHEVFQAFMVSGEENHEATITPP